MTTNWRFDPVINIGHFLVFGGVMLSAVTVYVAGEVRASNLDFRVHALETFADRYVSSNEKLADELGDIKVEIAAVKARLPAPLSSAAPVIR